MGIRQTDPRAEEGRSHTQFNVADAAPLSLEIGEPGSPLRPNRT